MCSPYFIWFDKETDKYCSRFGLHQNFDLIFFQEIHSCLSLYVQLIWMHRVTVFSFMIMHVQLYAMLSHSRILNERKIKSEMWICNGWRTKLDWLQRYDRHSNPRTSISLSLWFVGSNTRDDILCWVEAHTTKHTPESSLYELTHEPRSSRSRSTRI